MAPILSNLNKQLLKNLGAKPIGKGSYTKAYLLPDNKVILASNDPIKECMALGWFPDSDRYPVIDWFLWLEQEDVQFYSMGYYPYCRALSQLLLPDEMRLYSALRKLHARLPSKPERKLFPRYINEMILPTWPDAAQALLDGYNVCLNVDTHGVGFEISPRNVRVHEGKLIFMDCFFI